MRHGRATPTPRLADLLAAELAGSPVPPAPGPWSPTTADVPAPRSAPEPHRGPAVDATPTVRQIVPLTAVARRVPASPPVQAPDPDATTVHGPAWAVPEDAVTVSIAAPTDASAACPRPTARRSDPADIAARATSTPASARRATGDAESVTVGVRSGPVPTGRRGRRVRLWRTGAVAAAALGASYVGLVAVGAVASPVGTTASTAPAPAPRPSAPPPAPSAAPPPVAAAPTVAEAEPPTTRRAPRATTRGTARSTTVRVPRTTKRTAPRRVTPPATSAAPRPRVDTPAPAGGQTPGAGQTPATGQTPGTGQQTTGTTTGGVADAATT